MPGSLVLAAAGVVLALAAGAPVSPVRRSPVVQVVEQVSPSVVNISTEQQVENPFRPSSLDNFFSSLRGGAGPDGAGSQAKLTENSLGSGVVVDPRGYILTN